MAKLACRVILPFIIPKELSHMPLTGAAHGPRAREMAVSCSSASLP